MEKVVGISLNDNGTILYFNPGNYNLKRNVTVIVQTERGLEFGRVEIPNIELEKSDKNLNKVVRIASEKDYKDHQRNLSDATSALKKCNELIKKYKLEMQMVDASYTFDRNQLMFRYLAEKRVDFRELAKELATRYKTRIELRQIGVRDKAKTVGGCGPCGRKFCCSRFDNDFASVSINMAKNQNLSLNPTKINGTCGRLLCCLRYEDDLYKECRKLLPNLGKIIETKEGKGKVINLDVINEKYSIQKEDGSVVEIKAKNGSN